MCFQQVSGCIPPGRRSWRRVFLLDSIQFLLYPPMSLLCKPTAYWLCFFLAIRYTSSVLICCRLCLYSLLPTYLLSSLQTPPSFTICWRSSSDYCSLLGLKLCYLNGFFVLGTFAKRIRVGFKAFYGQLDIFWVGIHMYALHFVLVVDHMNCWMELEGLGYLLNSV